MPTAFLKFFGALKPQICLRSTISADFVALQIFMRSGSLNCKICLRSLVVLQNLAVCRSSLLETCHSSGSRRNSWAGSGVSVLADGCSSCLSVLEKSTHFGSPNCCTNYNPGLVQFLSDHVWLEAGNSQTADIASVLTMDKDGEKHNEKEMAKTGEKSESDENQKKIDEQKEKDIEDKIGPPPEKPLPGDCCGSGCTTCIWDLYWEELAEYKKLRESLGSS